MHFSFPGIRLVPIKISTKFAASNLFPRASACILPEHHKHIAIHSLPASSVPRAHLKVSKVMKSLLSNLLEVSYRCFREAMVAVFYFFSISIRKMRYFPVQIV